MFVRKKSVMEAWRSVLELVRSQGVRIKDVDGRFFRELPNLLVTVDSLSDYELPVDVMHRFGKWVYPGKDELRHIILAKHDYSVYEYLYGGRIFNFQGVVNQVSDFVIPLLSKNPRSRRGVVSLFDPVHDSKIGNREVPGLVLVQFLVRNSSLNLSAVIRSNEMFIGWPANIFQLVELQKFVASTLGLPLGSLSTFSISAHVFEDYEEDVMRVVNDSSFV